MDVHRGVAIKGASLNWYQDRKVEEDVVLFAERLHAGRLSRVLDFGCGTGRNTVYPCQDGIRGARLRLVYCAGRPCRRELSRLGLEGDVRVWDMSMIPSPYPDRGSDGILVMEVMHRAYADNVRRIAAEITRLTRSGGLLYVESPAYEVAHKPHSYTAPGPGRTCPRAETSKASRIITSRRRNSSPSSPASTRLT